MADDSIPERLTSIETLLESIELELVKTDEKLGALQVSLDNVHAEVRTLSGFMRGLAIAGVTLTESIDNLRDRIARLERRGPPPP